MTSWLLRSRCIHSSARRAARGRGHRHKRVVTDPDHEPGGDTRGAAGESGGGGTYPEAPQGPPPWRSETEHAQCFLGNRVYEIRAAPLRRNALEAERWIFPL